MDRLNFRVKLSPDQAANELESYIVSKSVSTELIDRYEQNSSEHMVIVLVFEKYYMRNSSRASLTVTIENLSDVTCVHAVGSGGGQGAIFKFDWGAGASFVEEVNKALSEYRY
ncbi:hypothetical protein EZV73_11190 [Acidaminobacter sp. JC074]|uniref:DUF6054 family protein n=1 Tax=Acidaminobacter sp. JC074 TaxID=2530199 RepID=UPI001F0E93B8|nr:DUF6054 family protein [Acidaminobacter sp. JC074]MCH4888141.1 hypothetical protein [Acidaminobacter sp. JC074]